MFSDEFLDKAFGIENKPTRAIYIAMQEFGYIDSETGFIIFRDSLDEIATKCNISLTTLKKHLKIMREAGFMERSYLPTIDKYGDNKKVMVGKLNQIYQEHLYMKEKINEHDQRLAEIEKKLNQILEKNHFLEEENKALKQIQTRKNKCMLPEFNLEDLNDISKKEYHF